MRKTIVVALAAIALAGCALGSQGPQADSYDLGPPPARDHQHQVGLESV